MYGERDDPYAACRGWPPRPTRREHADGVTRGGRGGGRVAARAVGSRWPPAPTSPESAGDRSSGVTVPLVAGGGRSALVTVGRRRRAPLARRRPRLLDALGPPRRTGGRGRSRWPIVGRQPPAAGHRPGGGAAPGRPGPARRAGSDAGRARDAAGRAPAAAARTRTRPRPGWAGSRPPPARRSTTYAGVARELRPTVAGRARARRGAAPRRGRGSGVELRGPVATPAAAAGRGRGGGVPDRPAGPGQRRRATRASGAATLVDRASAEALRLRVVDRGRGLRAAPAEGVGCRRCASAPRSSAARCDGDVDRRGTAVEARLPIPVVTTEVRA